MKLVFLITLILINFFNHSSIKSQEKINSGNDKIEYIPKKESISKDNTETKKIHIVKIGDTLSSISKSYSISKDLLIKLNKLKDANYIYVGQNLIISESGENSIQQSDFTNKFHIVKMGENLTDISNKYKLNLGYLIAINNLKNPDSIKIGQKLLLMTNETISLENNPVIKTSDLFEFDKQIYGPIVIQSKSYEIVKGRKVLDVLNQENKKLILSINCDTNELDVRIPGRKWMGSQPAKKEFEKNIINDFC